MTAWYLQYVWILVISIQKTNKLYNMWWENCYFPAFWDANTRASHMCRTLSPVRESRRKDYCARLLIAAETRREASGDCGTCSRAIAAQHEGLWRTGRAGDGERNENRGGECVIGAAAEPNGAKCAARGVLEALRARRPPRPDGPAARRAMLVTNPLVARGAYPPRSRWCRWLQRAVNNASAIASAYRLRAD